MAKTGAMTQRNEWTVKALRKALRQFDGDDLVVLAADGEGNGFDSLYTVEAMAWDAESREVHYRELTPGMRDLGYTEEDVDPNGRPAVVLWP
jgi:hypothetical protein